MVDVKPKEDPKVEDPAPHISTNRTMLFTM
jgi:hypothetical protein